MSRRATLTPHREQIDAARKALRRLTRGDGLVGTTWSHTAFPSPTATAASSETTFTFTITELVPPFLRGGHAPEIESAFSSADLVIPRTGFSVPETENHLLMIESSRYLVSQLLQDQHVALWTPPRLMFDNARDERLGRQARAGLTDRSRVVARLPSDLGPA
jgi:hypothetical protein